MRVPPSWLKDLSGRYLSVNRRYAEALGVDADSLRGRTDAELTPASSIEGLRLEEQDAAGWDHLELEYRIGAFEERPAFAALRFALHDRDGRPVATCSVAAPVAEAVVARAECERLMRIDRCARLDVAGVRQEVLDEWGLTLVGESPAAAADAGNDVADALDERDQALQSVARLEQELAHEREQRDDAHVNELEAALTTARAEVAEHALRAEQVKSALEERDAAHATAAQLAQELTQERERNDSLQAESRRVAEHAAELDAGLTAGRAEHEAALTAANARTEELARSLAGAEARAVELEARLMAVRAEHESDDESVRARTESLVEQLKSAEERSSALDAELAASWAEHEAALAAANARSEELERSLAAAGARAEDLEAQLTALRAEHESDDESVRTRTESLLEQLKSAEERSAALDAELAAIRADQEAANARSQESARSLAAAGARAEELETQLAASRAERETAIAAATERSEELARSLALAEARVSELQAELGTIGAEIADSDVRAQRLAVALGERDEALARAGLVEQQLAEQRAALDAAARRAAASTAALQDDAAAERARADDLERSLAHERAQTAERQARYAAQERDRDSAAAEQRRAGELEESVARADARVSELEDELRELRAQQSPQPQPQPAGEPEAAEAAEECRGPRWSATAQRTLSAALVGVTELRPVLTKVIETLGAEGGWNAGIAWATEEPRRPMRCDAIWTSAPGCLGTLETRTWQHRLDHSSAEFGRARGRMAPTCLLELASAEDPLLRAAADQGFRSALLVPVSVGGEPVAMLELLSREQTAPSTEVMVSVDAVALQLGTIAELIKVANVPRWRTGRV
jgi:hypothetical protein